MVLTTPKLDSLTGLRFFAAGAIIYLHYQGSFGIPRIDSAALGQGVSYFFVLSGFVLAFVYPELPTARSKLDFMIARVARIWPAYVIGILLNALLVGAAWNDPNYYGRLAINLLMIQTWSPFQDVPGSINGPSWSISTEFGLYIFFMFFIGNFERTWLKKLLLSAVATGSLVAISLSFNFEWSKAGFLTCSGLVGQFPVGRLFEFTSGMVAALFFRKYRPLDRLGFVSATALEIALFIVAVAYAVVAITMMQTWYNAVTMYGYFSAVVPATALIFVLAHQRGAVSKFLAVRPLVVLGELSYSLYLYHVPLWAYFHTNKALGTPNFNSALLLFICLLSLSYFSWVVIEAPARLYIRRFRRLPTGMFAFIRKGKILKQLVR